MTATTVVLAQMNRCIRIFRQANAINPFTAIIPAEHGIRTSLIFQKLVRQGIIIPVGKERYYLNEQKEAEYRKRRQSIALVLVTLIIIGLILGAMLAK